MTQRQITQPDDGLGPPRRATDIARRYLDSLASLISQVSVDAIAEVADILAGACDDGRQVFVIGNGGSAATASHLMMDLAKGALGRPHRRSAQGLRVISLTDNVPLLTAWANDAGYAEVFARPLRTLGRPGDVLLAISASGESPNVVAAIGAAKEMGMIVAGLTGFDGGVLAQCADAVVIVPSSEYGPVEDVHLAINHILTAFLAQRLAAESPS